MHYDIMMFMTSAASLNITTSMYVYSSVNNNIMQGQAFRILLSLSMWSLQCGTYVNCNYTQPANALSSIYAHTRLVDFICRFKK